MRQIKLHLQQVPRQYATLSSLNWMTVVVKKSKMQNSGQTLPYDLWFRENKRWLVAFLSVAFSGHAGLGMAFALFGPTQPYLGRQTGVDIDTVNFIWTARLDPPFETRSASLESTNLKLNLQLLEWSQPLEFSAASLTLIRERFWACLRFGLF